MSALVHVASIWLLVIAFFISPHILWLAIIVSIFGGLIFILEEIPAAYQAKSKLGFAVMFALFGINWLMVGVVVAKYT